MDLDRRKFLLAAGGLLGGAAGVFGVVGERSASAAHVSRAEPSTTDRSGAKAAQRPTPLYGSSPTSSGPAGIAAVIAQCSPQMIRCYDSGLPPSFDRTSEAQWAPPGAPLFHSTKPSIPLLAHRDGPTVRALRNILAGQPDVDGSRVSIQHEPETPAKDAPPWGTNRTKAAISPALFRAAWTVFLDLVDEANHNRRNPLLPVPVFMGYSLGRKDRDIVGQWLPKDPRITEVAFDVYATAEIVAEDAFSRRTGLRWSIAEWGYSAHGTWPTDAQYLARMTTDHALWTSVSRQPEAVLLFNSGSNILSGRAGAMSFWRALCKS
jgi:hypothetical protein